METVLPTLAPTSDRDDEIGRMSGASNYEQGRLRRTTEHGARNDQVDESAFKGPEELLRASLVARKRQVEADLSVLRARIARAKAEVYASGRYLPPKTFAKLEHEKAELGQELAAIERQFFEIKQRRFSARKEPNGLFYECFLKAAKSMLADVVYERVRLAAIHILADEMQKLDDEVAP